VSDFVPLADLCLKITKGTTPNAKDGGFADSGVNYIKSESLSYDGSIDATKFAFISEETNQRLKRSIIQDGDILYSIAGANLGKCGIARRDHLPANTNQAVGIIRVDEQRASHRFISFCLRNPSFVQSVLGGVAQSAQPNVNLAEIGRFRIPNLPLPEQRAIAATLGALDDKIELNRKMNATLEAMARALFRDWFVDFGPTRAKMEARAPYLSPDLWSLFPDRLGDEGKPEGWAVRTLGDVADQIAMGPFGSNIKVETFVDEGIPVISGAHLRGMQLSDKDYNFVTETHADKLGRSNVRRGDVVFTHAGNIGQVAIIPETSAYDRYVISQRQFYLRCNLQLMSPLYVVHYFHSPEGKHTLLANSSQVGVPSIARPASYLKSIEICCPPRDLLDEFDRAVSVLHLKVGKNERESRTLAQTRDLLLPRLMSGKLRVADLSASEQETAA
jgi:type I restriction enzyme S subunit